MLFASEKEYEFLKNEVFEVRSAITRYIGYIISVAGLSGIFVQYVIDKDVANTNVQLIILAALIIITLFFDIVWYKFKAHNRFVGYIQLLSQELGHYSLKSVRNIGKNTKKYLENSLPYITKEEFGDKNIHSWEFVMSRLNSAKFHGVELDLKKAAGKSYFTFKLPDEYRYSEPNDYKNLDIDFFNVIIQPLYRSDYSVTPLHKRIWYLVRSIPKILNAIIHVYSPPSVENYTFKEIQIDKVYLTSGWMYPKKITQVAFVPIFLLFMGLTINIINESYYGRLGSAFGKNELYTILIWLTAVGIIAFWLKRYLTQLPALLNGKNSIEYFCWTFFIFRVQLLNSFGIVPMYFSRAFIRYFKSMVILTIIKRCENQFKTDQESHCIACSPKSNADESKLCSKCFKEYTEALAKCSKFSARMESAHSQIKCKVNKIRTPHQGV